MPMRGHPIVHFEIGCHNGAQTREFFAELFDWEISAPDAGMMIDTGGSGSIGGHISELAGEWGPYVTVYVEVDDLEAHLKKATALGGKTLVPPVTLSGQGSFAWLAGPDGNIIGIWKPEAASRQG